MIHVYFEIYWCTLLPEKSLLKECILARDNFTESNYFVIFFYDID